MGLDIKENLPPMVKEKMDYNELRLLDGGEVLKKLYHQHTSIYEVENLHDIDYPIISVNRNRHQRFISLWKQILNQTFIHGWITEFNIMKKLKVDDILFYNSYDLLNKSYLIYEFCKRNKLNKVGPYFLNMIKILITEYSGWHNHDPRIIWFDFEKLYEMEEWISNRINMDFKLEKLNSSQHLECGLVLDETFIERYNSIYDVYDFAKNKQSLI